jgi:anthranilate/para-aminobenzoate synthase component I
MRTALAFLQTSADVLTSVVAPLDPVVSPRPGSPAFFAPDFAMSEGFPTWLHVPTDAVRGVPPGAFARQYGEEWSGPPLAWCNPDEGRFAAAFRSLAERLGDGRLRKGVPVTVMRAPLHPDQAWPLFAHAVTRLPALPAGLCAYGLYRPASADRGGPEFLIGATPELLFELQDGRRISTMAVAGTRRVVSGDAAGLLQASVKDRAEHQSVVDDLLEQLSAWGEPSTSSLEARRFGPLEHLAVDIRLHSTEWLDFDAVARRLHPTPALGVYPRGSEGASWLDAIDPGHERRRFGAPFGLRWPTGSGRAVVAIRNLQYHDGQLEIWAGCGVVAQSRYEEEWQEVLDKIQAVRALWGV